MNTESYFIDFVQLSDISKSLYILSGGTVLPNPTELLVRDELASANKLPNLCIVINGLKLQKKKYGYYYGYGKRYGYGYIR